MYRTKDEILVRTGVSEVGKKDLVRTSRTSGVLLTVDESMLTDRTEKSSALGRGPVLGDQM